MKLQNYDIIINSYLYKALQKVPFFFICFYSIPKCFLILSNSDFSSAFSNFNFSICCCCSFVASTRTDENQAPCLPRPAHDTPSARHTSSPSPRLCPVYQHGRALDPGRLPPCDCSNQTPSGPYSDPSSPHRAAQKPLSAREKTREWPAHAVRVREGDDDGLVKKNSLW